MQNGLISFFIHEKCEKVYYQSLDSDMNIIGNLYAWDKLQWNLLTHVCGHPNTLEYSGTPHSRHPSNSDTWFCPKYILVYIPQAHSLLLLVNLQCCIMYDYKLDTASSWLLVK